MKTFMEIGEFLANPLIAGLLFAVMVLPALWGITKVIQWIKSCMSDHSNMKNNFAKED